MRRKKCKNCGLEFDTDLKYKYLCDDCAKKAKQDSVMRDRTCSQCGVLFLGGPRARFCPSCRFQRQRDANKNRHTPATRPIGSVDYCVICGQPYTVSNGRQKYCPDCAPSAIASNVRVHKAIAYRQNKDEINQKRKDRRKPYKVCVICGSPFYSGDASVTCSPECARKRKSQYYTTADYKRGKRKPK